MEQQKGQGTLMMAGPIKTIGLLLGVDITIDNANIVTLLPGWGGGMVEGRGI